MKIRAYIGYNDYKKVRYYKDFEIVKNLPELWEEISFNPVYIVTKIEEVRLDPEQGSDDVYYYDFYKIISVSHENDDDESIEYIAIEKEDTEE